MSESLESHKIGIANKLLAIGVAASTLLGACGTPRAEQIDFDNTKVQELIVPDVAAEPTVLQQVYQTTFAQESITLPASATAKAVRLNPPKHFNCTGVTINVYGNSMDADSGNGTPGVMWPHIIERSLNTQPDLQIKPKIINHAILGSGAITPIYNVPTQFDIIKDHTKNTPPNVLSKEITIINPSVIELYRKSNGTTPEQRQQMLVYAVKAMHALLKNAGVQQILVMPVSPITQWSTDLSGEPLNKLVIGVNKELLDANLLQPNYTTSPLSDELGNGAGAVTYFDDFVHPTIPGYIDGIHPDADGHAVLAQAIIASGFIRSSIDALCTKV